MKKIILMIYLGFTYISYSQVVEFTVPISDTCKLSENSIAVCKNDPNIIISQHNTGDNGGYTEVSTWLSSNGGIDWYLYSQPTDGWCDPSVTTDYNGWLYYSYLPKNSQYISIIKTKYDKYKVLNINIAETDKPFLWTDKNDNVYCSFYAKNYVYVCRLTSGTSNWDTIYKYTIPFDDEGFINVHCNIRGITDINGNIFLVWNSYQKIYFAYKYLNDDSFTTYYIPYFPGVAYDSKQEAPVITVNNETGTVYIAYKFKDAEDKKKLKFAESREPTHSNCWHTINIDKQGEQRYPWLTSISTYKLRPPSHFVGIVYYEIESGITKIMMNYSLDDYIININNLEINTINGLPNCWMGHEYIGADSYIMDNKFYIYTTYAEKPCKTFFSRVNIDFLPESDKNKINLRNIVNISILPIPFNPITKIKFILENASFVKISIYDILGKHIITLTNMYYEKGEYIIPFNGTQLTSGIYFCNFEINNSTIAKKLVILK